ERQAFLVSGVSRPPAANEFFSLVRFARDSAGLNSATSDYPLSAIRFRPCSSQIDAVAERRRARRPSELTLDPRAQRIARSGLAVSNEGVLWRARRLSHPREELVRIRVRGRRAQLQHLCVDRNVLAVNAQ